MWDALITVGNLAIVPSLLPTLLHKSAYVPRATSGVTVLGLCVVFVGVIGAGLYLSAIALGGIWTMWAAIFVFRGDPRRAELARHEPVPEVAD